MARSFLAHLRGSDGRSLARAVALLFLVNLLVGAFHAGAMAGTGNGTIILCTASGGTLVATDGTGSQHDTDDLSCCVLGCANASVALPAPPVASLSLPFHETGSEPVLRDARAIDPPVSRNHRPRGPPVLA